LILGGWLEALTSNGTTSEITPTTLSIFNINQQRSWSLLGYDPSVNPADVGQRPSVPPLPPAKVLSSKKRTGRPYLPANSSLGLLGTFQDRFFSEYYPKGPTYGLASVTRVPWFEKINSSTSSDFDVAISAALDSALSKVAMLDKSTFLDFPVNFTKVNILNAQINELLKEGTYY
jgi:hypothetical protein